MSNIRAHGLVESGDLVKGIAAGPGSSGAKAKVTKDGFGFVRIGYKPDVFYGGFHELSWDVPAPGEATPAAGAGRGCGNSGEITEAFVLSVNKTNVSQKAERSSAAPGVGSRMGRRPR